MPSTPICLFEDREDCALGVKLLVMSARRHEPGWHFHAFTRNFRRDDLEWLDRQPNVTLRDDDSTNQSGWSVKPSLLKLLLEENDGDVIWCDSDIILASPVMGLIDKLAKEVFVATEEYIWGKAKGSRMRTAGWKFKEARPLKSTVNSCLMRVNKYHLPLLDAWDRKLTSPDYLAAQAAEWSQRPLHLVSDQDVLTALLASEEFAAVPLHLLRNGRDIAQCFQEDGYAVHDRLRNAFLRRTPPLVHAQGGKPWIKGPRASYQQLSPYNRIAAPYVKEGSLPDEWLGADDFPARLMDGLFLHEPNLRGLLPAVRKTMQRVWRHRPKLPRANPRPATTQAGG